MSDPSAARFAVVGMATMGRNLAYNAAIKGIKTAIYNRSLEKVEEAMKEAEQYNCQQNLVPCSSLKDMLCKITSPRVILMMIQAGPSVDSMIDNLIPELAPGDVLIDGGNEHFLNTNRRLQLCKSKGIDYLGVGISGGEEGARLGPSMMAGGTREAYAKAETILTTLSAIDDTTKEPCGGYVGDGGAGHFVKMVHNGIEYAEMQTLAEGVQLLRDGIGLKSEVVASILADWNNSRLSSFLVEITSKIMRVKDPENSSVLLVDAIDDAAGSKGTGKWTVQAAADLGVAVPSLSAALFQRYLSGDKVVRKGVRQYSQNSLQKGEVNTEKARNMVEDVEASIYCSRLCAYAQGLQLIQAASQSYGWDVNIVQVAKLWRAGCIIRSKTLKDIVKAYLASPHLPNLLMDPNIASVLVKNHLVWTEVANMAFSSGIPIPALSSSLVYFQALSSEVLSSNLIQAQRDFFGAHTFRRRSKPDGEPEHAQWADLYRQNKTTDGI